MDNLQAINELRKKLTEMRLLGDRLKKTFNEAARTIDQEKFAKEDLIEELKESLLDWVLSVKSCRDLYFKIFNKNSPDKLSDVERNLDVEEKKIIEAAIFRKAEKFLLLSSTNPDLQKILDEHHEKLNDWFDSLARDNKLRRIVEPYAKFMDAFNEPDLGKKFSAGKELSEIFNDDFIGCGLFGDDLTLGDSEEPEILPEPDFEFEEKRAPILPPEDESDFAKMLREKDAFLDYDAFDACKECFYSERRSRDKKFAVKRTARDLSSPYAAEKLYILLTLLSREAFSLAVKHNGYQVENLKSAIASLFESGYLQKYGVDGLGSFYTLTRDFALFFKSNKVLLLRALGLKPTGNLSAAKVPELNSHAAMVLAVCYHLLGCKQEIQDFGMKVHFFPQGFLVDLIDAAGRDFLIGNYFDGSDHQCDKFLEELKGCLAAEGKINRVIVAGVNIPHAEKTFDALETFLADEFPKTADFYIWSLNESAFYRRGETKEIYSGDIWLPPIPEIYLEPEPEIIPDDEPEEETQIPVALNLDRQPLDAAVKEKILADLSQLLLNKKFYCAAAYLKAQALDNEAVEPLYRQFAFALDDPILNAGYSAAEISLLHAADDDTFNEALMTAAALRAFFYNHVGFDYGVPALYAMIKNFELVKSNAALAELILDLKNFKVEVKKGVDRYADYQTKNTKFAEEKLAKVIRDAEEYYSVFFEGHISDKTDNEIFIWMQQMIFSHDGDLGQIFSFIKDKEIPAPDTLELVKDILRQNFIKDGASFDKANPDAGKLNNFIDAMWENAKSKSIKKKHTSKLMSKLRSSITMRLERAIEIICAWVNCAEIIGTDEEDSGEIEYKKIRTRLVDNAKKARENLSDSDAGAAVVAKTLEEISARLDGTYNPLLHKYFYVEFLLSNWVALEENYLPKLDLNISDGTRENIPEQIKRHSAQFLFTFEKRIEKIFEQGGDDFGTAKLIDDYLKEINGESFIAKKEYDLELCAKTAAKDARRDRENFIGGLELAQSYGQFDTLPDGVKEELLQLVDNCYEYAEQSFNYGVFFRVKNFWESKIEEISAEREEYFKAELNKAVDSFNKKNAENLNAAELADSVAEIKKIIESRNFTAAQSLIFKLSNGELYKTFDATEDSTLSRFIEEYSDCYSKIRDGGKSLETLIGSKIFPHEKVSRAKLSLIKNFPANAVNEDKIKTLLELLGFSVESVKNFSSTATTINYNVTILRSDQPKYNHPIAAFGSEAEVGGFRVTCLFGKYDEKNLIGKFKELGNNKHTLIFLDYALDLPTRRLLAKEIKLEKSLTKVFAVVDRVTIMYLIKNCAAQIGTKRINDTLMSLIMPFARYQPYIWSPKVPLPPEMFIGRENEINDVMSPGGVNIVCGGRQLGKSALLKMACRKIDGHNGERAIFIDIADKNFSEAALLVSRELSDKNFFAEPFETEDWEELTRNIRKRLNSDEPTKIPYFLLMMDEADKFIESCAESNYAPITALAKVQQEDYAGSRFKFVIAGLRNIIRFEKEKTFSNNSILPTLKALTIKPFGAEDARKLLEVPLRCLGLYFPDSKKDSLILTILETANYFPSLIQLYCEKLLQALFETSYAGYSENTPIYEISDEHIKKVLADKDFTQDIKNKIEITLRLGEDKYYYVIANLLAHLYYNQSKVEGYSPQEILMVAEEFDLVREPFLPSEEEKIGALMEELCELNILRRTGTAKYLFSRQRILRIVGTLKEVDETLLRLMEAANG